MWQVKYVAHKTQLLNDSRANPALRLVVEGGQLVQWDEMEVLGGHLRLRVEPPNSHRASRQRSLGIAGMLDEDLEVPRPQGIRDPLQGAGSLVTGIRVPGLGRGSKQTPGLSSTAYKTERRGSSGIVAPAPNLIFTHSNTDLTWRGSK